MKPWDVASGRAVVNKHNGRSSATLLGGTRGNVSASYRTGLLKKKGLF